MIIVLIACISEVNLSLERSAAILHRLLHTLDWHIWINRKASCRLVESLFTGLWTSTPTHNALLGREEVLGVRDGHFSATLRHLLLSCRLFSTLSH